MSDILENAKALLALWTKNVSAPEVNRLDVIIEANDLIAAVGALAQARWGYLAAITGLDLVKANQIEVLYHFCSGAAILTLRVRVERTAAMVASICGFLPYASPFERELSEIFGVNVVGTPDPSRLYLPEDWQEGIFPLRKDFSG